MLLCNGDGTFQVGNVISTAGTTPTAIGVGDLSGDGFTDIVLANENQVASLINVSNEHGLGPSAFVNLDQPSVAAAAATLDFTVTYDDAVLVETSTLGNGNLTVTDPSGNTVPATLVGTDILSAAATVTAAYSIPAPSGSASQADDGTYTVTANSNSAMNAGGLALPGGEIGQFNVDLPLAGTNGPNLVAEAVTVGNPATAVKGTRFAGATSVTVLNSGNQLAKGTITIALYASPDATLSFESQRLESVVRNVNLRPARKAVFALPGFTWPSDPGIAYIVADVNSTRTSANTFTVQG